MGVSGSGKSTVGAELAARLGRSFADGDDFHSEANRAKMGAGHPLTDEDLQGGRLPPALMAHKAKLYGLTIDPDRLMQIRGERKPDSKYASAQQVRWELNEALQLMQRAGVPVQDTTNFSIEEIATPIQHQRRIERRMS